VTSGEGGGGVTECACWTGISRPKTGQYSVSLDGGGCIKLELSGGGLLGLCVAKGGACTRLIVTRDRAKNLCAITAMMRSVLEGCCGGF
jgi:hypothetical protein